MGKAQLRNTGLKENIKGKVMVRELWNVNW